MTESPIPHYTVFELAYREKWHVYEVVPMYDVYLDKVWDAWITQAAEVKRYVGGARGIIGSRRWKNICTLGWKVRTCGGTTISDAVLVVL
jgi:hypothetical protein